MELDIEFRLTHKEVNGGDVLVTMVFESVDDADRFGDALRHYRRGQ